MIIVNPDLVTDVTLVASNTTLSVYPAWSSVTAYTVGNRVSYKAAGQPFSHDWEALVNNTNVPPGTVTIPATWLDLGASNRFAMFDQVIGTLTSNLSTIDVSILPGKVINAVALFGVTGNSVTVQVIDPVEGIVYNSTKTLQDASSIVSWYSYFFEPVVSRTDAVFLDLPNYGSATIRIIVNAGTAVASIGEVVIGNQRAIARTTYGTSFSIQDYSRKERDQFGNVVIVERRFTKLTSYNIEVDTLSNDSVQRLLASIRVVPTVFIGNQDLPETIVYGFYKNFNITISTPSVSTGSIEVEGLT